MCYYSKANHSTINVTSYFIDDFELSNVMEHQELIVAIVFYHLACLNKEHCSYLVRFKLLHCSPLWQPCLMKDILSLERAQCQAQTIYTE